MVALSLSDMFCVDRHRRDFLDLVTNDVDVLLCNETEVCSLFQVPTLEKAFNALEELGILAVVTRGPAGADVLTVTGAVTVPAHEVEHVIDQNGAGTCSPPVSSTASRSVPIPSSRPNWVAVRGEIISHLGARPENDLEELAIEAGLL